MQTFGMNWLIVPQIAAITAEEGPPRLSVSLHKKKKQKQPAEVSSQIVLREEKGDKQRMVVLVHQMKTCLIGVAACYF